MTFNWIYKLRGYQYDAAKHMWYKKRSDCCKAEAAYQPINSSQYRPMCSTCHEQCLLVWSFKHV